MSRSELADEVRRLHRLLEHRGDASKVVHDLEMYRAELETQQAELIESRRLIELSRDRYAELFDFAPISCVLLDIHGVVEDVNLRAAELLGTERRRLIGYPFMPWVAEGHRRDFLDFIARCRRATGPVTAEIRLRGRLERIVPVHLTTRRSVGAGPAFYMAMLDLTELYAAEEARGQAEAERLRSRQEERLAHAASEAKDRFLAVLSHELRTPLTPVLLAIGTLEQQGVPESMRPALEMMRRNLDLEARLIDDLLDVTRIVQGRLRVSVEVVDAHAIANDVVILEAEELRRAGLQVSLDLAATGHHVHADPARLRQVLWNLLSNAVRHTRQGGIIRLASRNDREGTLVLEVSDTGMGIAPEDLERVFAPFERGLDGSDSPRGLGLGLAICKGIMDAHGGRISARSAGRGKGATFAIELAVVAPPAVEPAARRREIAPSRLGLKVLVVEDNRDNATAMAELLTVHGYTVTVACSVQDALGRAAEGFDILVSDIGLPDGSGRDLMRELCKRGPVKGIALSGYGTDADMRRNTEAGFSRHLTKPVDPHKLLGAIAELSQRPGVASAAPGR